MCYSIVEMCMGFIKLRHKSSASWIIVHVGIVRQMGRHIITSSCSHYCGIMQAETAGMFAPAKWGATAAAEFWAPSEGPVPLSQCWGLHQKDVQKLKAISVSRRRFSNSGLLHSLFSRPHFGLDKSIKREDVITVCLRVHTNTLYKGQRNGWIRYHLLSYHVGKGSTSFTEMPNLVWNQ